MLSVIRIPAFNDNYIWLFHANNSNKAYVVDPGCGKSVLNFLNDSSLELAGILITHHHSDHTGGIEQLQLANNNALIVYGPASENITGLTHPLEGEQQLSLEFIEAAVDVITVPGHTLGHIAYQIADKLFCGDTLFSGGCGRLFEGTAKQMSASLGKLAILPTETEVYCAHEYTAANLKFALVTEPNNLALQQYIQTVTLARQHNQATIPSTIGTELAINPFLRSDSEEIKAVVSAHFKVEKPSDLQTFTLLREWKNNF
ncbi:hydroxyacylglutathione hydrolase [Shewanella donghaensis]|uniref:hydroxyacylglutathione hydrolase n=1 Tax=Shewanella donghaensis TaxID=238836 RepID=UPI001183CB0E|nr:hydroxyacylglutathione hydrolase [Shewanella donghaensis]